MTGPHDEPGDAGDEELDELLEPTTDLRTAQEKEAGQPASAGAKSVDSDIDEDCDAVDESADDGVDEDERGGRDA